MIAGAMLRHVVHSPDEAEGSATLGPLIAQIGKNFWRSMGPRISAKTINNSIWPKYRKVATFWAAYLTLTDAQGAALVDNGANERLPCLPRDLGLFLALADEYRIWGEIARMKRRRETILTPGNSISVPSYLQLPGVALAIPAPLAN